MTDVVLPIFTPIFYGDHPGTIGGFAKTGGFTIDLPVNSPSLTTTLVGDSDVLTGFAVSAPNTLSTSPVVGPPFAVSVIGAAITVNGFAHTGGNNVTATSAGLGGAAYAAGDAVTLAGHAQGGHNTVLASGPSTATAYGDALNMTDFTKGGFNTVSAQNGRGGGLVFGDAGFMSGFASGGHNTLHGSEAYGDAFQMSGFATGGHNTLDGASGPFPDTLYGDAFTVSGFAHGGGNTLTAAPFNNENNLLYGDAHDLLGFATGGGNTLIFGFDSSNTVWGGAANVSPTAHVAPNTFVMHQGTGHSVIMDFRPGEDHIDLQGFGLTSFDQLAALFQQTSAGLDIVFATVNGHIENDLLLSGVNQSQVSAGDFMFS